VESDPTGVLIAARSDASHALVDVRVLAPALREDRAFMRRLGHDMDILREVRHTNLVSVMYFDKKVGAVVYEAVPGSTLTQLVAGQGPLELAASLVLLEDTISGLEALHKAGVVHGNLTADSVVVETTGAVLLRDAGTAPPHSETGLLAEQQPYIAPEVLAGASPTTASDLYAATAVFLQSLGGRASKTGVRADLRSLLNEGMAKDPSERATFGAFRRELDDYARATFGETWRKDGRALLTAAAAAQASRAIRLSSPSDNPTDGADAALAAVAVLRSPAPPDSRIAWGVGMLGFVALLAVVVLLRGLAGGGGTGTGPLNPGFFNPLPVFGATSSPSPSNPSVEPGSSPSTADPGTTPPNLLDPISTPRPTGDPKPTPTPNPGLLSQRITWTSPRPSGSTYGQTYQASAYGGGSGNPVVFSSLNTLVCSAVGATTFDFNGVGTCYIQASQAGNSRYNPTANPISFLVGKASQTITFTSEPDSPTYGGGYNAIATAPGGPVTFSADPSSVACSVSTSGTVQFTATGDCIIDANQGGNADYTQAVMLPQQFRVAQAPQTISITSQPPTCPCTPGQLYTVVATGGDSGNPLTYNVETPLICTIAGPTVTIIGTPGTCTIDVFQAGNSDYAAAEAQQTILVS
jgi:serine/threonine protein kinase